MKQIFYTILFFIVAILLTNPVNSVRSVVAVNPHDSCTNPQYNYPTNIGSEKPNSKEFIPIIILLLSIGLIGLAEACKQKKLGETIIMERKALPDSV